MDAFPLSTTRAAIFEGFSRLIRRLTEARIVCDLVVDGSFLTEEIEPEDIDLAVVVTPVFYENCSSGQRSVLDWIRDDFTIRQTHLCDCYLCVEFGPADPQYFEGIQNRAYWVDFYSTSVVYKRARGVAILRVGTGK